jgi:isoleucyl-tRNA synthetase
VLDGLLDVCTVDLSAVFLDVAKDRLYTLLPDAPERRSAQTVLWQALHDLVVAAAPALVFTSEEVWQSHPGLLAECPSVHLAQWPEHVAGESAGAAWRLLRELRDAVNAALEPLRAAKQLASTAEAEVAVTVAPAIAERLAPYAAELGGFLIVAEVAVRAGRDGQAFEVEVAKTTFPKCERCWMHRRDVTAEGANAGLCGRCAGVLAARGGPARV